MADDSAVFGVFCRRFGVPLIDGGTVRLPRAIGMSRALDLMLTGRAVDAAEALHIGLANRVVPAGELMAAAEALALQLAAFPQACLKNIRTVLWFTLSARSFSLASSLGDGGLGGVMGGAGCASSSKMKATSPPWQP